MVFRPPYRDIMPFEADQAAKIAVNGTTAMDLVYTSCDMAENIP